MTDPTPPEAWPGHVAQPVPAQPTTPQPPGLQPYYPAPPVPYSPLVGRPLVPNETTWSMLAHLSIFALGLLGPILIMVTEGKKSPYTRYHAVEALNMHLTLLIAEIVCLATFFLIVPLLILFGLAIAAYVYGVLAGMAANRGELFRYPLTLRMVS